MARNSLICENPTDWMPSPMAALTTKRRVGGRGVGRRRGGSMVSGIFQQMSA